MAHERATLLMPWYANGTLEPAARREVADRLEDCASSRALLEHLRRSVDLAALEDPARCLEHVSPRLLTRYAEDPARVDAETAGEIRERLEGCATCREAYALLIELDTRIGVTERRGALGRLWDGLAATALRPAPALAYLVLLALLPAAWIALGPRPRGPLPAAALPTMRTVDGDRALRTGAVPSGAALELDATSAVLLRLRTDLEPGDVTDPDLSFRVELLRGGETVWSKARNGGDFTPADGRLELLLLLHPEALRPGVPHVLVLRAVKPGDPLDGQALFRRTIRIATR